MDRAGGVAVLMLPRSETEYGRMMHALCILIEKREPKLPHIKQPEDGKKSKDKRPPKLGSPLQPGAARAVTIGWRKYPSIEVAAEEEGFSYASLRKFIALRNRRGQGWAIHPKLGFVEWRPGCEVSKEALLWRIMQTLSGQKRERIVAEARRHGVYHPPSPDAGRPRKGAAE